MFTYIDELDKCKYAYEIFQEFLSEVQKIVDEFCLHDYSNILKWISAIDGKIERILFERLQAAINLWKEALIRREKGKVKEKKRMRLKVDKYIRYNSLEIYFLCRKLFSKFELLIKC